MAPSLAHLPPGCAFAPRCARADAACDAMPELTELAPAHAARCWHPYRHADAAA
jgi:peptide/nickel transport system ATP-binding protein